MKRAEGIIESVKTLIFAMLFVGMVLLASAYILSTQGQDIFASDGLPFDKVLSIGFSDEYGVKEFDSRYISPEMICIRQNGGPSKAIIAGDGYLFDAYDHVMPIISEMFGENGKCERIEGDAGRSRWKGALGSNDHIYVAYHSQFPFSILYAYSNATDDTNIYRSLKDAEAYISEFVVLEENGTCELVARDLDANVYVFTSENAAFDIKSVALYAGRGVNVVFEDEIQGNSIRLGSMPVLDAGILTKRIFAQNVIAEKLGDPSADGFRSLMRLFNFNPDKLNSYSDTENESASVFVEAHGTLRMSEALLEYNSEFDGGISILDFLSYRKSDQGYDLYDALKATQGFVEALERISKESFGGDAGMGITGISYTNGVLAVEYSYFFENVRIDYGDAGYAFRFEISEDAFTHISVRPLSLETNGDKSACFSQRLKLNMEMDALEKNGAKNIDMKLGYKVDSIGTADISAEWTVFAK